MNDTQIDDFFNDKLQDHAAPVPKGLWEKVAEGQFDQFIGNKLKDNEAPVPAGLWDKIADAQFDNFIGHQLYDQSAPVPSGLWDKIADLQFDNFIGKKLSDQTAPVPAGLWDKVTDGSFDNFVAGKLVDFESPIPAGLWERVRPKDDDDPAGFILFRSPVAAILLVSLLIAGTLGGYLLYTSHKQTPTGFNPMNTTQTNVVSEKVETKEKGIVTNKIKENSPNRIESSTLIGEVPIHNQAKFETATEIKNAPLTHSKSTERSDNLITNQLTLSSLSNNKKQNLGPFSPTNNKDLSVSSYEIFKENKVVTTEDKGNKEIEDIESFQHNLLTGVTIPYNFNLSNRMLNTLDKKLSTTNHTSQFRSVIICPADNKNRNTDWYLEAYASPDIPIKSVNNIQATPIYLLKKDSSETMQISYSAGIRLVKPIANNILLKAGVQYSQANEKYVYRTENEIKTTTVVTVRTIIRGPGDTVIVKDTSTLQTIGFHNNTVYNHYNSFDIPITVGYQFGNEDLKFGINGGVVLNLSSWYEGVVLDSTLAVVTLQKTGNNIYKTKLGLGLYGGLSVVKRLSDDMHIFFEPYFRYNLSNMTTDQSSFNQKFSFGGLAIGLRFNLNRKY